MKKLAESATRTAKAVAAIAFALFLLAHVEVHASVGGATVSASVLVLVAAVLGLLVAVGAAFLAYVVVREVRAGTYRPRHA